MKFLLLISSLMACSLADTYLYPVPLQQLQTPLLVVRNQPQPSQPSSQAIQQYFSQDSLGQYSYGYSEPLSTKQEIRTLDGVTSGSYSYVDANGLLQTVDYTADDQGFHVIATNLPKNNQEAPKPVQDTPEVVKAREQHLAAHRALLEGKIISPSILPKPVEDTTEVAEAKKEFFARFSAEEEKQKFLQKSALLRNQPFVVSSAPLKVVQPNLPILKSKPAVALFTPSSGFASLKTPITPSIKGFSYGYQIGGDSTKPSRHYLPSA